MARKRSRRRVKRLVAVDHGEVVLDEAVIAAASVEFLQNDDATVPWSEASADFDGQHFDHTDDIDASDDFFDSRGDFTPDPAAADITAMADDLSSDF